MESNIIEKSPNLKPEPHNKKVYSEDYSNDVNEYRKHMDEIYKNFPNVPETFTGFFLW